MRDAARAALPAFLERWEGRCSWMYLDTLGLVTCGVGCKVDDGSPGPACGLPWLTRSGGRAMLSDVVVAWQTVKAAQAMRALGGGHFAPLTEIRLADADIDALLLRRWAPMEVVLRQGFPNWDGFPAAAQLAIADMSFNMGPSFDFPKFRAFCNAQDWAGAATECIIPAAPQARNDSHVTLFRAAMGDPDTIPT